MHAELREGRDLVEHWPDNMPVFNVHVHGKPRSRAPRPSGRSFAERNPRDTPYDGGWSSKYGAELLPNVPAQALHELLDAVEAEVLASDPDLARFVPPRAPSPWAYDPEWGWWPKRPE
jgi:hypothetical protein